MGIDDAIPVPLQLHLEGFRDLTDEAKEFHIRKVHDSVVYDAVYPTEQHRRGHLAEAVHGFKKGKVKSG